ncbi:hypothetical protein ADUPG1_006205 [Aduncisulcus paluster]|uniref:Uncharacterized protein n=1 Tax=Aduncisulcus paluster TaxID=2918883 RepID=A0ABQ5KH89_9EUKA|nr:hypothetical protein ADUPG1_006205 [Aduncisulcus paluster]
MSDEVVNASLTAFKSMFSTDQPSLSSFIPHKTRSRGDMAHRSLNTFLSDTRVFTTSLLDSFEPVFVSKRTDECEYACSISGIVCDAGDVHSKGISEVRDVILKDMQDPSHVHEEHPVEKHIETMEGPVNPNPFETNG